MAAYIHLLTGINACSVDGMVMEIVLSGIGGLIVGFILGIKFYECHYKPIFKSDLEPLKRQVEKLREEQLRGLMR